jgi:hypothetical protein
MYCKPPVLFWIPLFLLLASPGRDDVARILDPRLNPLMVGCDRMEDRYLWIGLDFEPVVAQVTFTSKREDGSGVVVSYFLLLGIIPDTHTYVVVASITKERTSSGLTTVKTAEVRSYHQMLNGNSKRAMRIPWSSLRALSPRACLPRNEEGQKCMLSWSSAILASDFIETPLGGIVIRWIVSMHLSARGLNVTWETNLLVEALHGCCLVVSKWTPLLITNCMMPRAAIKVGRSDIAEAPINAKLYFSSLSTDPPKRALGARCYQPL